MTDYRADLAAKMAPAVIADRVARTRKILAGSIGTWIRKYHGGVPIGFAAAAIQWESDGIATTVGDPSLGEYGYLQVTAEFPTTIGLPAAARFDPENNVFLGLMDMQIAAAKLALLNRAIVPGSVDQWKLARLSFAIGQGGTQSLMAAAMAWRKPGFGEGVYDVIRAYVDAGNAPALGSQSADLVWYRVHTVDVVWLIGSQAVTFQAGGPPTKPPAPPAGPYTLPASVASSFRSPLAPVLVAAAAAVGVAAYLKWSRA